MTTGDETAEKCRWCASWHLGRCPEVGEIEYYENGAVKRVRFNGPSLEPVIDASKTDLSPARFSTWGHPYDTDNIY